MIKKQGTPWYGSGRQYEVYLTDDAQPIPNPGYANYDLVYINEEDIPKLSEESMIAFGTATTVETYTTLLDVVPGYGHLKPIQFEGKTLYPDISGWNIDR